MELAVLIQPVVGNGYRAWCGDPLPASAEGATREEALANLRQAIEDRVRDGVQVVRLRVDAVRLLPTSPVWPDDDITRDWLAGIAAARQAADQKPDPWDDPDGADRP
jgi:hypothetical protein